MNDPEEQPEQAPVQKRSKLPIILGCSCLLIVVLCGGLCGGGLFALRTALTNNEPYRVALEAARADSGVMEAFGGSIEPGFLVMGSINVSTENGASNGSADITIPIKSPAGAGSIAVKATKVGDQWTIDSLIVKKDDTGKIWDLTPASP